MALYSFSCLISHIYSLVFLAGLIVSENNLLKSIEQSNKEDAANPLIRDNSNAFSCMFRISLTIEEHYSFPYFPVLISKKKEHHRQILSSSEKINEQSNISVYQKNELI